MFHYLRRDRNPRMAWLRATYGSSFQILELYHARQLSYKHIRIPISGSHVDVRLNKRNLHFRCGDAFPHAIIENGAIMHIDMNAYEYEPQQELEWKKIASGIAKRRMPTLPCCDWRPMGLDDPDDTSEDARTSANAADTEYDGDIEDNADAEDQSASSGPTPSDSRFSDSCSSRFPASCSPSADADASDTSVEDYWITDPPAESPVDVPLQPQSEVNDAESDGDSDWW